MFFVAIFPLLFVYSQSGHGLEAKITEDADGNKKYSDYSHFSFTDLETFPPLPFFRFNAVRLITAWPDEEDEKAWDTQSIDEKCQFFEDQFKLIKPEILNDSILCFAGTVDENDSSRFSDHSELLSYVRSRLLTACDDKPRGYYFVIDFNSEKSAAKCVITSLLQIPQIKCCFSVQIGFISIRCLD